jgi:hypothetical protein
MLSIRASFDSFLGAIWMNSLVVYILYMIEALRSPTMRYLDDLARNDGARYRLLGGAGDTNDAINNGAIDTLKSLILAPYSFILLSALGFSWLYRKYLDGIRARARGENGTSIISESFYQHVIIRHQLAAMVLNCTLWIVALVAWLDKSDLSTRSAV